MSKIDPIAADEESLCLRGYGRAWRTAHYSSRGRSRRSPDDRNLNTPAIDPAIACGADRQRPAERSVSSNRRRRSACAAMSKGAAFVQSCSQTGWRRSSGGSDA